MGIKVGQIFYTGCQHTGDLRRLLVEKIVGKRARCRVVHGPRGMFEHSDKWVDVKLDRLSQPYRYRPSRSVG